MAVVSKLLGFPSLTLAAVIDTQSHLAAIATILLVNCAFGIVVWVLLYPMLFSPLRQIPGPKASKYLSPAYRALIVKDKPAGDLFLELAKQYPGEDLITLNSFGDQICIMNPQLLADLLVYNCYNFAKPKRISSFLRHILGDGLIIVEGDQHKFLRRNTMPAFHFRHIKELYPMMWAKGETLVTALNQDMAASRSSVVELNGWATKVTLDIIGIAGLGHKFDAVEKRKDAPADTYEQLLEPDREKLIFAMLSLAVGLPIETLRLYPTVPTTIRHAVHDTRIGGQFIPEGADIIVSIWYINRSSEIWGPDAAEFRPERWIRGDGKPNQNGGASSNYNFLTFLHGPRSCIGQGFAKTEMRCLLATMVRSFKWTLAIDDGLVMPRGVITIKPENGMYLNLRTL
ncbi:cytochrome P450 4F4 [Fusarium oxysporum Fo47]|uniref:cytochrome P450 4F4 n=1 Tax=Fusarium oxysporum Fo47 TaxID=660027 RepID=UPI002869E7ED|nr:cytochrome P450 4F4 [Fusarium oxysporum Fo47]QKD56741.2 cytochrome P450 4F4 [Fusarium oxysporum Fo47]